jgi:hypothetical protein
MANFWEYFHNSGLQKPDDPGDPSMPYGPPLWPTPQMPSRLDGSQSTVGLRVGPHRCRKNI